MHILIKIFNVRFRIVTLDPEQNLELQAKDSKYVQKYDFSKSILQIFETITIWRFRTDIFNFSNFFNWHHVLTWASGAISQGSEKITPEAACNWKADTLSFHIEKLNGHINICLTIMVTNQYRH